MFRRFDSRICLFAVFEPSQGAGSERAETQVLDLDLRAVTRTAPGRYPVPQKLATGVLRSGAWRRQNDGQEALVYGCFCKGLYAKDLPNMMVIRIMNASRKRVHGCGPRFKDGDIPSPSLCRSHLKRSPYYWMVLKIMVPFWVP